MYPSPQHFIIRPGDRDRQDTLVPLIATDQLPDWIRLAGAPRELDAEHAAGLRNLGVLVKSDESCYEASLRHDVIQGILQGAEAEEENEEQNDGSMKPQPYKAMVPESIRNATNKSGNASPSSTTTVIQHKTQASRKPQQSRSPAPPSASSLEPTLASRHNNTCNTAKKEACILPITPPHSTEEQEQRDNDSSSSSSSMPRRSSYPAQHGGGTTTTTNNYCRHWCHHGTCKWGLECRYTHRMPKTVEGLRDVGLRTLPLWYNLLMMSELLGEDSSINTSTRLINNSNNRLDVVLPHLEEELLAHGEEDEEAALHHHTQLSPHHHRHRQPSSADVSLVQSRISALLSGSRPALVDNDDDRQQARQMSMLREMLMTRNGAHAAAVLSSLPLVHHRFLNAERTARPNYHHPRVPVIHEGMRESQRSRRHQGRANLHTNASLAANAADLSAANGPVAMTVPLETRSKTRSCGGNAGPYDELEGRLSPVASDGGVADNHSGPGQGQQLVDVD